MSITVQPSAVIFDRAPGRIAQIEVQLFAADAPMRMKHSYCGPSFTARASRMRKPSSSAWPPIASAGFFIKPARQPHAEIARAHRPVFAVFIDGKLAYAVRLASCQSSTKFGEADQHVTLRRAAPAVGRRAVLRIVVAARPP